jgi:hypothetical protein
MITTAAINASRAIPPQVSPSGVNPEHWPSRESLIPVYGKSVQWIEPKQATHGEVECDLVLAGVCSS